MKMRFRTLATHTRTQGSWLLLVAALAGCGAQPTVTPEAPPVNLSGFPPAFREGYADGCNTARGSAKQDAARMKTDGSYSQGYKDGLTGCKVKVERR